MQAATFGKDLSSESKHNKPALQESKKDTSKIENAVSDYVDTRAK